MNFVKRLSAAERKLIKQFIKFGMVGTVGFVVDVGVLKFCTLMLGMNPYGGRVFSFLAGASTTWILNRVFTFRGEGRGPAHVQWAKFLAVSAGGFTLNYGTYSLLIATIPLVREYLSLGVAAGSIAGMFFNFFVSRKVVFR
jgi:putative flippase GtrA